MLITDKNLGCIVVLRTLIIDKTTCLFSSQKDYKYININTAVKLMKNRMKAI